MVKPSKSIVSDPIDFQSSQSRIAKLEAGDPSVSLDHYMKSLIALGASRKDIANAIA
jgi:hypothetical protein